MQEKNCLHCGKLFTSQRSNHNFCSQKCGQRYYNALRPKVNYEEKNCKLCCKAFKPINCQQLFCCSEHKISYFSARAPKVIHAPMNCAQCGKEFIPSRKDAECCSKKCTAKRVHDRMPRKTNKSYIKAEELRNKHIPQDQLEVIYGCIIGDGFLSLQTNNFHRLSLCHSIHQLDYLVYKMKKINSIFMQDEPNKYVREQYQINGNDVFNKTQYHAHSISHNDLTNIYGLFYRNKQRIVTMSTLDILTLNSFLIWYLDDGFVAYKNRSAGLCTNRYSLPDVKTIQQWLWQKYGLTSKIRENNKIYNDIRKTYYILRFPVEDTKKLFSLFSTCSVFNELPECMAYKFKYKPYLKN